MQMDVLQQPFHFNTANPNFFQKVLEVLVPKEPDALLQQTQQAWRAPEGPDTAPQLPQLVSSLSHTPIFNYLTFQLADSFWGW